MKHSLVFGLIVIALVAWRHDVGKGGARKATPGRADSNRVIIEYRNNDELLAKLRQVRPGQMIDLREIKDGSRPVIKCGDPRIPQMKSQLDEINAELRRINQWQVPQ